MRREMVCSTAASARPMAGISRCSGYTPRPTPPTSMDDKASGDGRLRGHVLLTEALGSEILAHVEVHAKPVVTEDVVEGIAVKEEQEVAADLLGDSTNGAKAPADRPGR